ncbi:MAG: NAD(+)/NADH kinase [Planctomycetota bacterium]|jgi:NAD+ kinase
MSAKLGLLANLEIEGTLDIAKEVLAHFPPEQTPVLDDRLAEKIGKGQQGVPLKKMDVDIIIAIGGDGTILRTLQINNRKILGINAGVLGFLTEISKDNLKVGLDRLMKEDFIVDERTKLRTVLNSKELVPAVNEAVIHTAQIAKIQSYDVFVDGQRANKIRADGIIIATPTGSTCYAMSTGGPILDPNLDGFVITPIAPFKLAARPIVVSSKSTIKVALEDTRRPGVLVLDGQQEFEVKSGDALEFSQAIEKAQFIRFDPDFYKRVAEKLEQAI